MTADGVLDDLRALIYRAQTNFRAADVGLGKREVHPLAYNLSRESDSLFSEASFHQEYRGVRSSEVREALVLFDSESDGGGRIVLAKGDRGVVTGDTYYYLAHEDDIEAAQERLATHPDTAVSKMDAALANLTENRDTFLRSEAATKIESDN